MFEKSFHNYPDAVILFDEFKIIDANNMCIEMLGWSKEELKTFKIENALKTIISTKEKENYIEHKINRVLDGEIESFNSLSQRKDNSIFHAKFSFFPFFDHDKRYTQVVIKDTSERVIFEDAIRTSEERFKIFSSVVHNSTVFLFNDIIVDCNDQFVRLFGYHEKKEFLGKQITSFIESNTLNKIKKTLNIEQKTLLEIKTKTKQGEAIILEASINKINYQGQNLEVLLFNDITFRKRTELALEQTTNRYKNLVNNSPDGIFIVTNHKIKFTNQRSLIMLGYNEEDELYDKNFLKLFPLDFCREIEYDMIQVRSGKELSAREVIILKKDKTQVHVSIKLTLTVYNNEPSFQINVHNLTTRKMLAKEQMKSELLEEINRILKIEIENHKATQQKLQDARDFNENIFESSIDMLVAFDRDGFVSEFNTAAQKSFGYSKEEALKMDIEQFFNKKADYSKVEKKVVKNGRFVGELNFKTKTNKKITAFLSASWIKNKDGKILGTMGILRDITELKKAEKRATEERAKLDSIFNSTENMMIWTMSKSGRISSSNKNLTQHFKMAFEAKLNTGANFLKVIEKHINQDVYQKQLEEIKKGFEGETHQLLLPLLDLENNEKWMQIFINPIYIENKISDISCLMFDISERIIIEKKIRDSLKEKEVLLNEVHHRVKNNLQVISSILNLQSGYVEDKKTLQILEESQSRIKAMSYIHETLYQTSDFSAIDFTDYMNTLVQNLVRSYNHNVLDLNIDSELDQIELALDHSIPCGLIVNELVTNAMKYAYDGIENPCLIIRLSQNENLISMVVADNGIGLPEDFKYEEADSLGIQLVYTLVEQLNGNIEVNRNSGTEFLITFDSTMT